MWPTPPKSWNVAFDGVRSSESRSSGPSCLPGRCGRGKPTCTGTPILLVVQCSWPSGDGTMCWSVAWMTAAACARGSWSVPWTNLKRWSRRRRSRAARPARLLRVPRAESRWSRRSASSTSATSLRCRRTSNSRNSSWRCCTATTRGGWAAFSSWMRQRSSAASGTASGRSSGTTPRSRSLSPETRFAGITSHRDTCPGSWRGGEAGRLL
mmetsp:Transcript_53339/g.147760  ORF Transcript_53339/g.147760 Transcript_53339/m.147760 type:complete len:210 (+) Transcript_53339:652-1281(+)